MKQGNFVEECNLVDFSDFLCEFALRFSSSMLHVIIYNTQSRMGNKQVPQAPPPTPESLGQACLFLAKHQGVSLTKQQTLAPVTTILHSIRTSDPIQKQQDKFHVNPSYLKLIFSPYFSKQMMKFVQLLITMLEDLNRKSLAFVKIQEIVQLATVADFVLYFSNEKILENFDTLLVRSDVSEENRDLLKAMEKEQEGQLEINGNIVQKMNPEEQEIIEKCLRVTIMNFINIRLKPLSRSQTTLKYFGSLEQSLFMLYTKVYFAHHGGKRQQNIPQLNQHFKSNLTIGAYFLASGTSHTQPSVYEAAVVFLYSFLKLAGVEHKEVKSLPSHMFKNLPIIATHSMYEYILCNTLFSLKYIREAGHNYLRFAFNRIFSLKLVEALLKNNKIYNKTITYYLEELCLQVKIGQIERACLCQIVQLYLKDNEDKVSSQILPKFLQTGNLKYNLKFTNKQIKVTKQQLLTELEDDDDTCRKEYYMIGYKFVLEKVLHRIVAYNFNDRLLWQEILPNLMNSKEDEEVRMRGDGGDLSGELSEQRGNQPKEEHVSVLEKAENEEHVAEKVEQ